MSPQEEPGLPPKKRKKGSKGRKAAERATPEPAADKAPGVLSNQLCQDGVKCAVEFGVTEPIMGRNELLHLSTTSKHNISLLSTRA